MRTHILTGLLTVFAMLSGVVISPAQGQTRVTATQAIATAAQQQKYAFVLFWRQEDAATDAMAASLRTELARHTDRATTAAVLVDDPNERELVKRFALDRAPMPMILAVAPNGAVTGAFQAPLAASHVEQALVTPAMANCMKAMQDGKIVVLLVHPQASAAVPAGPNAFLSDSHFGARSVLVHLNSSDPAEGRFLQQMKITSQEAAGCVAMMAPPAVFVGKFPWNVSGQAMATKLHAAGKCCDDENCKHNQLNGK